MLFRIISGLGKTIRLEEKIMAHILEHPEMRSQLNRIKETATKPDEIHKSIRVENVVLFYKFFERTPVGKKYMVVVAKLDNDEYSIVTAYYTDRVKEGDLIWP